MRAWPRRNQGIGVVLSCLGLLSSGVPPAWAQDPIHKAGRGIVNVLTGWIEVPKQLYQGAHEANPIAGAGYGLLKGLGLGVVRIGIGAYETVTFPIPYPRQFASPYDRMELTDYAWE
jgi:putative exosortase-associated protein (TIGR04073 family)